MFRVLITERESNDINRHRSSSSSSNRATGSLEDLRIDGLSNYTVKQADFPMADFKAKVTLLFHEIKIKARYDLTGTFLDEDSFHGWGDLA